VTAMKKALVSGIISMGMLFGTAVPGNAYYHSTYYRHSREHHRYVEHKRHVATAKRVGVGAVGGAVVGGLVGGGKGAGIGALAGAGAGALYDRHEKHTGHY